MKSWTRWTPARLERLRVAYGAGATAGELAGEFGVSKEAIRQAASRAGIQWGGWPREQKLELDARRVADLRYRPKDGKFEAVQ